MSRGRAPSTTPDLFSTAWAEEPTMPSASPPPSNPPTTAAAATTPSFAYVLPKDLATAIKQLQDEELDRLSEAVLAEQKRRGKKLPVPDAILRKQQVKPIAVSLTPGKLNAVRAAFKAGVKPSQIARQFGISQADVRKALADNASKR